MVLNQLYKHTAMQSTFGVIILALVNGAAEGDEPEGDAEHFIDHRHKVIVRRTQFELDQAQAREHILEGLKIAVDNIDEVIQIIRSSKDVERPTAGSGSGSGSPRSRARRSSTCGWPGSPGSRSTSWKPSSRKSGP